LADIIGSVGGIAVNVPTSCDPVWAFRDQILESFSENVGAEKLNFQIRDFATYCKAANILKLTSYRKSGSGLANCNVSHAL